MNVIRLRQREREALAALTEDAGFTTGQVAKRVPNGHHNGHIHSAWVRGDLLEMEKLGLVRRLDDQKPGCWCRTAAGTAALKDPVGAA